MWWKIQLSCIKIYIIVYVHKKLFKSRHNYLYFNNFSYRHFYQKYYDVMIIMITHIIIHIKHITFLKCFHRLKCIQVSDRLPKFFRSRYLTFTHQNDQLYRHKISYIVVFWYTFYEKENTNLYVFRVVAT